MEGPAVGDTVGPTVGLAENNIGPAVGPTVGATIVAHRNHCNYSMTTIT